MKRSLFIFFFLFHHVDGFHSFPYRVSFDLSMKSSLYPKIIDTSWGSFAFNFFKKLYEQHDPFFILPEETPTIPLIIHQIWLGSKVPKEYKAWRESWKFYHPSWKYYLWTDEDLQRFPLYNRDLYEAETNYGARADIARYEILYQVGGLYVDIDGECLAPFDLLHHYYTFYIGIQPLDTNELQLGIGFIGAAQYHPLLKYAIDHLHDNANLVHIIEKTGPIYFTKIFCQLADQFDKCIALPPSYLYPRGYNDRYEDRKQWLCSESLAIHHWGGSWLKPEAFIKK